jgi:hypothetical protein
MAPSLLLRQRPRVDHEDSIVIIEHEDHLKHLAARPRSPDQPLGTGKPPRKRAPSRLHNDLGVFGIDSVPANVLDVPCVPPELHNASNILHN